MCLDWHLLSKSWSFITVSLRHTEISFTNALVVFRLYYLSGANQSMSLMPHVALVWCYWRQPGMKGKWVSTISYCLRIKHHMPHTWPSMLFCSETEWTPVTFQTGHCTAQHRRVNASMNWYMYICRSVSNGRTLLEGHVSTTADALGWLLWCSTVR